MGDGSLSQDEIDALLQGADDVVSPSGGGGDPMGGFDMGMGAASGSALSGSEQSTLSSTMSTVMTAIAPSLSGYLQKNITITNPQVEVKQRDAVASEMGESYVQVSMGYNGGLNGQNLIVFTNNDAGVISALMMGDESGAVPQELTEAHQSTLQEFVSSLLSSASNQLGEKAGSPINTTPPTLSTASNGNELQLPSGEVVKITYNINIEGVLSSTFYHIMESNLGVGIARSGGGGAPQAAAPAGGVQQPQGNVNINPVKYPPLGEGMPPGVGQNIGLLMDVQLTLTVELGRTKQLVKDILGLGEGSIIELDKLAGEPVDLLVNNKLIAKGEVVVIDENFGVRVTDIVSPSERLNKIGTN